MDRIAYVLSLTGDLHSAHVTRVESARKTFKTQLTSAPLESSELLAQRQKRVFLAKELQTLMPERAKAEHLQSGKLKELEESLRKLEADAKSKEEEAGKSKRVALRKEWEAYFDSVQELGEKLSLAAKYGKLLARQLPEEHIQDPIVFPADRTPRDRSKEITWSGAVRVAEIRAAVAPALDAMVIDRNRLPNVPSAAAASAAAAAAPTTAVTTGATSLGRSDTVSYGVSHANQLIAAASDDKTAGASQTAFVPGQERIHLDDSAPHAGGTMSHLAPPGASNSNLSQLATSPSNSSSSGTAAAAAAGVGPLGARINLNPSDIPVSPRRDSSTSRPLLSADMKNDSHGSPGSGAQRHSYSSSPNNAATAGTTSATQHRVPPLPASHASGPGAAENSSATGGSGSGMFATNSGPGEGAENPWAAPEEPTVAETGSPIVGPGGPKTGQLRDRRPSQAIPASTAAPVVASGSNHSFAALPPSQASGSGSGFAGMGVPQANYYETTSDARARKEAEAERERLAAAANANQSPSEDLPPYSERGLRR